MAISEDELKKRVGLFLRAARKQKGWTRVQLSDQARVSQDMIGRIERGGTGVRFPILVRLSNALEIDPANLFAVSPPMGAASTPLQDIVSRLAVLPPTDLSQMTAIIEAALKLASRR